MNRQRKRDEVMQELIDEVTPRFSALFEPIKQRRETTEGKDALDESDAEVQKEAFMREHNDILETTYAWLVHCLHVRPYYAMCMTLTVTRLMYWREGVVDKSTPCDPVNQRWELAKMIAREVVKYSEEPADKDLRRHLRSYVNLLLTRYSNLRESCGSLFGPGATAVFSLSTGSDPAAREFCSLPATTDEPAIMQALFDWVWCHYQEPILRYQAKQITWLALWNEWNDHLVWKAYTWLCEHFPYEEGAALNMVRVVGFFVREQLGIGGGTNIVLEHREAAVTTSLTQAVMDDLKQLSNRGKTNRSEVNDHIGRLLTTYRTQLHRPEDPGDRSPKSRDNHRCDH